MLVGVPYLLGGIKVSDPSDPIKDAVRRGDMLCNSISNYVFELLIEQLGYKNWRFEVNGLYPELQFGRDPDVWPIFVDIGDERYAVECEVFVRRIAKDGPDDTTCTEAEAFPPSS